MRNMPRLVSLAILLGMIAVLGSMFFQVLAPFLLPLFLAGMTAVVCQPVYRYFLARTKNRSSAAAGLTTLTVMMTILLPLVVGTLVASLQLYAFARNTDYVREVLQKGINYTEQFLPEVPPRSADAASPAEQIENAVEDAATPHSSPSAGDSEPGANAPDSESTSPALAENEQASVPETDAPSADSSGEFAQEKNAEVTIPDAAITHSVTNEPELSARYLSHEFTTWMKTSLVEIGDKSLGRAAGTTLGFLAGAAGFIVACLIALSMYAIALYYFLADGPALLQAGENLIPVHAAYQRQLMSEFSKVVRSVVLATFLAAIGQGLATTLALWFFGFDHLFAFLALATFGALIPLAGTWLVWFPCAIALFVQGHPVQGTLLALYGAIFVGMLDNVIRTYVLNNETKLHPLLAFISVLGGIQVLGLWGVFIGPIIACCLHALVKIFNEELQLLSQERSGSMSVLAAVPTSQAAAASISEPPDATGTTSSS